MRKNEDVAIRRKTSNLKVASSGASHLSKGSLRKGGQLKAVRTTTVVTSPLATGTIVGAIAVGFYGVANILRYKRNEKSGAQAAKDTITGSAGVGISTGLGVAVANAVGGTLGSTVFLPLAAGAVVAYAGMAIWDKFFYTVKIPSKTN